MCNFNDGDIILITFLEDSILQVQAWYIIFPEYRTKVQNQGHDHLILLYDTNLSIHDFFFSFHAFNIYQDISSNQSSGAGIATAYRYTALCYTASHSSGGGITAVHRHTALYYTVFLHFIVVALITDVALGLGTILSQKKYHTKLRNREENINITVYE